MTKENRIKKASDKVSRKIIDLEQSREKLHRAAHEAADRYVEYRHAQDELYVAAKAYNSHSK